MLHGELLRPTSPFFEAKERVVDALFAQRELPFVVLRPAPYQEDLADIMSAVDAVNRIFFVLKIIIIFLTYMRRI